MTIMLRANMMLREGNILAQFLTSFNLMTKYFTFPNHRRDDSTELKESMIPTETGTQEWEQGH